MLSILFTLLLSLSLITSLETAHASGKPSHTIEQAAHYVQGTPSVDATIKKPDTNPVPSLWANPLVKIGAAVAILYAGGAVVAAAVWYRIKDLFPVDSAGKPKNDDDEE